jgi:hypothetical protein
MPNPSCREMPSPIYREIPNPRGKQWEGEPSVRKLRERERARVSAIEELARMYREAEKRGSLDQLDIRVRNLIERVKASNGGSLPEPKGGRPFGHRDSKRLSYAIKAHAAIAARGKKKVTDVLYDTAEQLGVSYDYLYEIYYDIDSEWRQDVKTELARKEWEAIVPYSLALWFWAVEFDPMRDL